MVGRLVVITILSVLSLALAALGFLFWSDQPVPMRVTPSEFQVPVGAPFATVISRIQEAGIGVPEAPFKLLARYRGVANKIKPGVYAFSKSPTPTQLLDKMVRGEVVQIEVTIPEGWTFRQIMQRLDVQQDLQHELSGLSEAAVLKQLGIPESHLEGLFFPDTYRMDKGSSDTALLRTAYRAMQGQLMEVWQTRPSEGVLKSAYQALILASIIEKETGRAEDRRLVGAVFANRLRKGMLLQTDPTVIYGLGASFDGNLRKRDLLTDTPYNTYTRVGLPPTPIAVPGRASLEAAVHPINSDALYFVARGDGSSEFSATLEAHNRAVNRYQRGGK